jgi:stage II sporulation protein D
MKMKTSFRKVIALVLFLSVLGINPGIADSAMQPPEKVRVGLLYKQGTVNTSVASFTVDAEKGIVLGTSEKDEFIELYGTDDDNTVTIRKDAFFTISDGIFKEYDLKANSVPQGEKLGAYHIQINGQYRNRRAVENAAADLEKHDIEAYPVYADGWYLWTGFYTSKEETELVMKRELKDETDELELIYPSATRVAAFSAENKVIMLFESASSFLQVYPTDDNDPAVLTVNGKGYRGAVEVRRYADSDMTVINILPLEEYLYGVLPNEIEAYSHVEALKAQAVTARTYTINNLKKHSALGFDLCPTTSCQVYKGFDAEQKRTNDAVDDTEGEIVTYDGKPALVFYHSSDGGSTEDVKNVWGSDIPYLKSVEDKYESGKSYNYNWEVTFTPERIKQIMQSKNYNIGEILSITTTKFSETGRVTEMVVKGTRGEPVVFKLENCRLAFNLYSQWFRITTNEDINVSDADGNLSKIQLSGKKAITADGIKTIGSNPQGTAVIGSDGIKQVISSEPSVYKFIGKGWGHGIGLSQEGAKGMANAGFTYEEILTHYFQGTVVE